MRIFSLSILFLLSLGSTWAQEKGFAISLAEPLTIDGDEKDWPEEAWQWNKREPVRYAVAFDGRYLYLAWATEDIRWQNQVLMTGLSCVLEPGGKKTFAQSIQFPPGVDPSLRPKDPNQLARYLFHLQRNRPELLATMHGVEVAGFPNVPDTTWLDNPNQVGLDLAAGMGIKGNSLVIEYRLELASVPVLGTQAEDKLALTWETGYLGRPEQLRGQDAAGLSNSAIGNQVPPANAEERQWYRRLDDYRGYAASRKVKLRRIKFNWKN